ncbi:MAG: pilin [Patescibacteria group bacterium]
MPNDVNLPMVDAKHESLQRALRLVFGVAGGVALLIVTIAGFKYVLSQGNPQETAKAKDAIMYALIGLVVIIVAFTIVTFVIGRI